MTHKDAASKEARKGTLILASAGLARAGHIRRRMNVMKNSSKSLSAGMASLRSKVDILVQSLQPSHCSEIHRKHVLLYLRQLLKRKGLDVYQNGSFAWNAYLPDSDIDIGVRANGTSDMAGASPLELTTTLGRDSACLMIVNETLCVASCCGADAPRTQLKSDHHRTGESPTPVVRNISFVNGHVKVVKCVINNITVDVCPLNGPSLAAVAYFEAIDRLVGTNHLFKRSVILIKSWCAYEGERFSRQQWQDHWVGSNAQRARGTEESSGPVVGARFGGLSSHGLSVMIASLFLQHMKPLNSLHGGPSAACTIRHPFDALVVFLNHYAAFDWGTFAVSMFGPTSLNLNGRAAAVAGLDGTGKKKPVSSRTKTFQRKLARALRRRSMDGTLSSSGVNSPGNSSTPDSGTAVENDESLHPSFLMRSCNIIDPFDSSNNLGRSMNTRAFQRMKRMLANGRTAVLQMLQLSPVLPGAPANSSDPGAGVDGLGGLDGLFRTCFNRFSRGDGWRPDILVHPCQKWHGRVEKNVYPRDISSAMRVSDDEIVVNRMTTNNRLIDGLSGEGQSFCSILDVDQGELDLTISGLALLTTPFPLMRVCIDDMGVITTDARVPRDLDTGRGSALVSVLMSSESNLSTSVPEAKDRCSSASMPTIALPRPIESTSLSQPILATVLGSKQTAEDSLVQQRCIHSEQRPTSTLCEGRLMPSWVNFLVYIVCGYLSLAQVRHEFQSLFRMKQEQASRTGSLPMVNNDNANTGLTKFSVIGSDIDDVALQQNYGVEPGDNLRDTLVDLGAVRPTPLPVSATVFPRLAPIVQSHISNQWVSIHSQVIFRVNVDWRAGQHLSFQWRRNGVDIPNANADLMILGAAGLVDEGTYTCAVSNQYGDTIIWEESVLHVASPPVVIGGHSKISVQPGDSVSLSVDVVSASPKPKFQWRMNGVDIPGAISEKYIILAASQGDVGTYTCMVANLAGSVVWEEAIVMVEGINPLKARGTSGRLQTPAVTSSEA